MAKDPDLHSRDMGTCGLKYRPFADGPAMLMELLVDDVWYPIVTEFLPEHIVDRFKQAQAEWYDVLSSDKAHDIKADILQNATKPSIQKLIQDRDLQVIGNFPLKEFYHSGQQAISAKDWVRYFIEVATKADKPSLKMLEKVCREYLIQKGLEEPKRKPELLPIHLSRGQNSSSSETRV